MSEAASLFQMTMRTQTAGRAFYYAYCAGREKMTCNINPTRLLLIDGNQAEYTKYIIDAIKNIIP